VLHGDPEKPLEAARDTHLQPPGAPGRRGGHDHPRIAVAAGRVGGRHDRARVADFAPHQDTQPGQLGDRSLATVRPSTFSSAGGGSRRVAGTTRWNAQPPAAARVLIAWIRVGAVNVSLAITRTRCILPTPRASVTGCTDDDGEAIFE